MGCRKKGWEAQAIYYTFEINEKTTEHEKKL